MPDPQLLFASVTQLRQLLDRRQVSSVELTQACLERIEALNPRLNAFLTVTADEALASAQAADQKIARGEVASPLIGIPISVKDLELTKGVRTTLGSLAFKDTVPDIDSVVVERVRASGAVMLGKTNTPEFGLMGSTENRLGEPCRNPWNPVRTAGGSSGGAAAALAVGMCPISTGSDGGGSIRNPSSFCHLYGIKPTLGRVPRAGGLGRPSPNLTSQSGPISRTVRDSAILLQVMAGYDPRDPGSLRATPPNFLEGLGQSVRGLKIAWSTDLGYAAVDPEVVDITHKAAHVFEELGCAVDEPDFALETPVPAFLDLFYTNGYVSYGHLLEDHADELSDNARYCLEYGQALSGASYAKALRVVEVLKARLDDLMEQFDLLLTPAMAVPAFPLGQFPTRIAGQEVNPRAGYSPFTRPFNLSGQPAASVPCGFTREGLPVGLHVVGRRGEEATVLRASAAFEEARPWAHLRPPMAR